MINTDLTCKHIPIIQNTMYVRSVLTHSAHQGSGVVSINSIGQQVDNKAGHVFNKIGPGV